MYFINDGVYGSFNCLLYDHAEVEVEVLDKEEEEMVPSSLWGPTCDGLDCVLPEVCDCSKIILVSRYNIFWPGAAAREPGYRGLGLLPLHGRLHPGRGLNLQRHAQARHRARVRGDCRQEAYRRG